MPPSDFAHALEGVFEHSAWIAVAAEGGRPFADVNALHRHLMEVVKSSPRQKQLVLLRAHPDLAGRLAQQGLLTSESAREQKSAGLGEATPATLASIRKFNADYRTKFHFPFIICARLNKVDAILSAMEQRLHHIEAMEIRIAIEEIGKIALLRLTDLITS